MESYTSDTAEFSAFETGAIDMMDSLLTPDQYATVSSPSYSGVSATTGYVAASELCQYDLNNYFEPFNSTLYRQAFAEMINRTDFLDTYFAGGGTPCYDPLDFNPFGKTAEATCAALYTGGFAQAYEDLCASGYKLVAENSTNGFGGAGQPSAASGYSTWFFTSPFPKVSSGTPAGVPPATMCEAIPNATVQIFARTEHTERTDQATYLEELCGGSSSSFTKWVEAEYASNPSFFSGTYDGYSLALPTVKGVVQYPVINFQVQTGSSEVADVLVMSYYRYEIYTGAWILDELNDGLEIWLSVETPMALGWSAFCLNYDCYVGSVYNATLQEPQYDADVFASLSAPGTGIGQPTNESGTLYWATAAQILMMGDVPMIPMWYYSGYSAVLTRDNYTINALGTGFDNWYTYMDAQTPSGTIVWGWSADIENPNPISSTWAWDWDIMGPIYDSMFGANPYNLTLLYALATSWNFTPVSSNYWGGSEAYINLRDNAYWQDLPAGTRNSYMFNDSSQLNNAITDKLLTPADVAFTYEYILHDGDYQSVHIAPTIWDVGQVDISSVYEPLFTQYNTTYNNVLQWHYVSGKATTNYTINDVPGYTWENITYIDSFHEMNGTFGISVPTSPMYTPSSPQDFIQFSPSLNATQLFVQFIDVSGWLVYYEELGIPIIPMYIFANLAEASWPNSAIHHGFMTPSSFSMVLDPAGANLLYGSGPYIWTGFKTGTYTLSAFDYGVSYEGVTEDHSYWLSLTYPVVPVSSTTGHTVNPTTGYVNNLNFSTTIKNLNASYPEQVDSYQWSYEVWELDRTTDVYSISVANGSTTLPGAGAPFSMAVGNSTTLTGSASINTNGLTWGSSLEVYTTFIYTFGDSTTVYSSLPVATITVNPYYPLTAGTQVVGQTGYKVLLNTTITDTGLVNSLAGTGYWSYAVYDLTGLRWITNNGLPGLVNSQVYNFPALLVGQSTFVLGNVSLPWTIATHAPNWNDSLAVWSQWTFGTPSTPGNVFQYPYLYLSPFHPADIAGAAKPAGYTGGLSPWPLPNPGANGQVYTEDLKLLATYWLTTVPSGTNPTSNWARADMLWGVPGVAGSNSIGTSDLKVLSNFWLDTW